MEQLLRGQQSLVDEVHQWLQDEQKHDDLLRAIVLSSRKERITTIEGLDGARIFHRDTIRGMCLKYRLRFLDAGLFKGDIPLQALHAIRMLERRADGPIKSFMIMAPASRFKLCDSEADPLLFIPVAKDQYYLVHKWGRDLSPLRAVFGLPGRSPLHLAVTIFLLAVISSLLVPAQTLQQWDVHRMLFLLWTVMVYFSFTVFAWFAFFGQFTTHAWNSRFFNG